jgi:hypothetical protein
MEPEGKPGRLDFVGWRRRVISDRTWFGMAFVVMGSAAIFTGGWSRLLASLIVPGIILINSGVRRAANRVDPTTGERSARPPW